MPRSSVCRACGVAPSGVLVAVPGVRRAGAAAAARGSGGRRSRRGWRWRPSRGSSSARELRRSPLIEGVQTFNGGHKSDPQGRGTDAIVQVENTNDVPVDVVVRAEGIDAGDNVVISEPLKPVRRLDPGETRDVRFHWDVTPLESIEYTVIDVAGDRGGRPLNGVGPLATRGGSVSLGPRSPPRNSSPGLIRRWTRSRRSPRRSPSPASRPRPT